MTELELRTTAMAVGGEAVAREPSGRVVFVAGAAPGETVLVHLTDERRTFARGSVLQVVSASPDRVEPPCPHVAEGCGGCDWQHLALDAQARLRRELVADVLRRDGGVADPVVVAGPEVPAARVRTTVRGTVGADGRFAFRRRRSHEPVPVASCLVAHPLVDEVLAEGRFDDADEVTVRVGARTGERLVVVGPTAAGVVVPSDVTVVGADQLRAGHRAWIHEEAAGCTWRVSAGSFFQASPEGAEALVAAVGAAVARWAPDVERLVDLCCGVGLFAGTVGVGRSVVGVERSASAVADARHNLADLAHARLVKVALARWRPSPADVVVADPARSGLGADGVRSVAATGAGLCVLVSCDPASLGRDARLLSAAGYRHVGSSVLDLFGHTGQVEVVSAFAGEDGAAGGGAGG
ncbi:MAG: class I SAM-dependent RNA methyltransferase [Actinobacteria bacterium]|nr:class I SAM-dependent RNA methyltransferase [Actinomycetota bacterium]